MHWKPWRRRLLPRNQIYGTDWQAAFVELEAIGRRPKLFLCFVVLFGVGAFFGRSPDFVPAQQDGDIFSNADALDVLDARRLVISEMLNETIYDTVGVPLPLYVSITDNESAEKFANVQNRIRNTRFVFCALAWVFLCWPLKNVLKQERPWILPHYEAIQVQLFLLLILLGVTSTVQLWIRVGTISNHLLNLSKLLLQALLLLWGTYALPRATFEVFSFLEQNEEDEMVSDSDDGSESFIAINKLFLHRHKHSGPSNRFVALLSLTILFIVRPVLQLARDMLFQSAALEFHGLSQRDIELYYGLVDFVITSAGVILIGVPGFRYFHELRTISNSQRWIWGMLQAFVIIVTLEGLIITWMTTHQLATDLKALLVLFEVAVCAGITDLINRRYDDVRWIFRACGSVMEVVDISLYEKLCHVMNPCLPFVSSRAEVKRVHVAKRIFKMYQETRENCIHLRRSTTYRSTCSSEGRPMAKHQIRYLMPYEPSPELESYEERNVWPCVTADIFSSNVRSQFVATGVFASFVLNIGISGSSDWLFDFLHINGDGRYLELFRNLVLGVSCYIATAIMLHGNNIFVSRKLFTFYCFAWAVVLLRTAIVRMHTFLEHDTAEDATGIGGCNMANWFAFSIAFVCMNTIIVVFIRFALSEDAAEYIRIQIAQQCYSALRLDNQFLPSWPEVGEKVMVKRHADDKLVGGIVSKNHENGFYDIQLDRVDSNGSRAWTVLRKRLLHPAAGIPKTRHRQTLDAYVKTFIRRFMPPSHFPVIVLVSVAITACAIFAVSAVAANAATLLLDFCINAQTVSKIVNDYVFEPQPAGCTKAGAELYTMFDVDRNGLISHQELPLFSILSSLPPSVLKYMIPYDEFMQIWPSHHRLSSEGLSKVMCLIRHIIHEKMVQAEGVATIITLAYHTNLTGQRMSSLLGSSASKLETKALLVDAVEQFVPSSLGEVVDNGMTYLWNLADRNGNGKIGEREWDTIALGMNFLIGRVPEIIGLLPCAHEPPQQERTERRLTKALEHVAGIIKLTNWNFNNELEKDEWMLLVNILSSLAGHGMAKKYLEDAFDYVAEGDGKISWPKVEELAGLTDKFLTHASSMPTIIDGGNFTARDVMKFLITANSNRLTRDEAKPFETVLSSNSNAIKADMCLEAGFAKADTNRNGVLEGTELDDPQFGAAVKESFGTLAIQKMKESVNSIPKNCLNEPGSYRKLRSIDPSKDQEDYVDTALARILYHAIEREYSVLQKTVEESRTFVEARAVLRMLSAESENATSGTIGNGESSNVVQEAVDKAANTGKSAARGVRAAFTSIVDGIHSLTSKSTISRSADIWLKVFSGPRSKFALHCMGVVCYGSNVLATVFAALIVHYAMQTYRELFFKFKSGKTNYQGSQLQKDLANGHATVTFLPAQVAFSIMLGWVIAYWLSFIVLALLSYLMIYWEWTVNNIFPLLVFYAVYLGSFFFLQNVVIEKWLVGAGTGEIIYPRLFSCLWIVFIVYNFVFGVSLAIYRIVYMFIYMLISSCFLHYSIFPASQLSYDPGYYCLLVAAYTAYERSNPIKNAFVSVLVPGTHRRYGPARSVDEDDSDFADFSDPVLRRIRARNRFNLALTLWRNPTIKSTRHPDPDPTMKNLQPGCCSCCEGDASGSDGMEDAHLLDAHEDIVIQ